MSYTCPGCKTVLDSIKSMGTHVQHGDGSCTLEKRFDGRCDRLESGCIIYRGATDKWGYAHVGVNRKRVQAHRWSYERHNGPIPKGMLVCHSCDNPPCVNPEHLFLGTDMQNTQDMIRKGRKCVGERVNTAKLNPDKVREIRRDFRRTSPRKSNAGELAAKYGVTTSTIYIAVSRRKWKHVQ